MTQAAGKTYGFQTGIAPGTATVPVDQEGVCVHGLVLKAAFAPRSIYF